MNVEQFNEAVDKSAVDKDSQAVSDTVRPIDGNWRAWS